MGKRNGLLRFWGALALCLCLCTGALAESLQGYTVAEKLVKQPGRGQRLFRHAGSADRRGRRAPFLPVGLHPHPEKQ